MVHSQASKYERSFHHFLPPRPKRGRNAAQKPPAVLLCSRCWPLWIASLQSL